MDGKLNFFLFLLSVSTLVNGFDNQVNVDVHCDSDGMDVQLRFNFPFNGTVYSQDHMNSSCRYISPFSNKRIYKFHIPIWKCGTEVFWTNDAPEQVHALIFQHPNSESYAHRLTCSFTPNLPNQSVSRELESRLNRSINRPVITQMEIRPFPDQPSVTEVKKLIHIGDKLQVVVHIQGGGKSYLPLVKDCEIRDEEVLGPNSTVFKLSDAMGCPVQPNIFSNFEYRKEIGTNFYAYAQMRAFRFSEREKLFLTCTVEICFEVCSSACAPRDITQENVHSRSSMFHKTSVRKTRSSPTDSNNHAKFLESLQLLREKIKAWNNRNIVGKDSAGRSLSTGTERGFGKRMSTNLYTNEDSELKDATLISQLNTNSGQSIYDGASVNLQKSMDVIKDESYERPDVDSSKVLNGFPTFSSSEITINPRSRISSDDKELGLQNFIVNVTKDLKFAPEDVLFDLERTQDTESFRYCFPKVKFIIVSIILLFLLLCLLLASIFMCLHIRKEKKKHVLDRFLLYSFY